jgi:hypothetical protein
MQPEAAAALVQQVLAIASANHAPKAATIHARDSNELPAALEAVVLSG